MSKTVLITGGAGFIGGSFLRHLYARYPDYRLIVLDALTYAGSVENLPVDINTVQEGRVRFWYGNVRNADLVDTLVAESDLVVHFAAETHVTRSIFDNLLFFETDVIGTQTVANAVLRHRDRVERFVHISTSEVYGTAQAPLMDEAHPLAPMSPYASAKAGADRLVFSYWATYGIPAAIVRPFNAYGPRQHLEKAVPRFITSCLLGESLRVHGDGSAARDYLYVEDLCQAIDLVLHAPPGAVHGEVFNVASGTDRPILGIARDVVRLTGSDPALIGHVGERPGQVFRHTGDAGKIQRVLGWRPQVAWEEGLLRSVAWYREHRAWWERQLWMRTVPIVTARGTRELH